MPAAALMSPMAIRPPRRDFWPEYASAPVTGCSTPTLTVLGCAPATSGKATALATAADCDTKRRRLCLGLSFFSVELDWPGRHVLAGPHLRVDAAHAGELHFVGVAVGAVQAMQPLHRLLVCVVDQAAHCEQGRADRHVEVLRERVVGQPRRDGLVRPA